MVKRIIVGPHSMYVECHGVKSDEAALTETDFPKDVLANARDLWETIRPFVSWAVWVKHRLRMAAQRRMTALVQAQWSGPYHRGPRPDLIAQAPWKEAKHGQWTSLPHGVVHRLMRQNQ